MLLTVVEEELDSVDEEVNVVLIEIVDVTVSEDEVLDVPGGVEICPVVHIDDGGGFWKVWQVPPKSLAALKSSVSTEASLPLMTSILEAYARSPRPV